MEVRLNVRDVVGGQDTAGKAARNCWVVTDYIVNTTSNLDLLKKL